MGGIGSGNRQQWALRTTVADYRRLDVRRWARDGFPRPGSAFGWQWTCDGAVTGSIRAEATYGRVILDDSVRGGGEWEQMRYPVHLPETACHLGGARQWFRCPARGCGRRVATLYGGRIFACRQCRRRAYPSRHEDASDRAARRADRLRVKLGWEPGILNGNGVKPKGMHRTTFGRMAAEHDRHVSHSCTLMMQRFGLNISADWSS